MINRICVLGAAGNMGSKHLNKLLGYPSALRPWGWDISNEGGAQHWQDTAAVADSFVIATPSNSHYEIAKYLIEHGKNVLVEKPVTLNYKQAQTLYRLSREYNVVFMTGHNYGFNPDYRRALPELYHVTDVDFKILVPHKNTIENATFDLAIHGMELCFNLGQRDFSRDFELLDCYHDENTMVFKARIGSKNCTITAGYNCEFDVRQITGFDPWGTPVVEVNFHDADGQAPDAMHNLHDAFIRACDVGVWQPFAENAVAAVQLAEQVQECLFPGVDPVV